MKRTVSLLLCIAFILLSAQGCAFPQSFPIEGFQNILIAGIDLEDSNIVLTTLVDSVKESAKPGEEQIEYKLYVTQGKTMFEAKRALHSFAEKTLDWYHTKYILISEDAAKQGLDRIISFFYEDDETKMLFKMAIVKGMTSNEFLNVLSKRSGSLADYLDSLFGEVSKTGKSREFHILNYAIIREIPWSDVRIPTVEIYSSPEKTSGSSKSGEDSGEQEPLVRLEGYTLFNNEYLVGFINGELARGLNFITNDMQGSQYVVMSDHGHSLSLEIMDSKADINVSFDPMYAEINVSVTSNLVEYHEENPLDPQVIDYLKKQQSEAILNEILQAVIAMKSMQSDAAGIGDKFYHTDPVKWQNIKGDWKNIFSGLEVKIKVDSNIMNTYEFAKPIGI